MEEQSSPLIRLMQTEGFKPFSGPDAIRVYQKAKTRLNMESIREDDLLNAVSSLGVLLETEIALMYALQDQICTNCGKCCTDNKSLRLPKTELKQIYEDKLQADKKGDPGETEKRRFIFDQQKTMPIPRGRLVHNISSASSSMPILSS